MRRKSNRTLSKSTPEKPVESPRKSRRQSRRHKKSSSRSSSEESKNDSVIEQKEPEVPTAEAEEEPTWKIAHTSTPTGDIQKIKFCLKRPLVSPEKVEKATRQRSRSKAQTNEDEMVVREKISRKSRHRASSDENVEEQDDDIDHQEDKKGKGKSKTKHKSKSEKVPQTQDLMDNSQSEISENVQVTPQSPQAPIDIAVDNENMSTNENETVTSDETPQLIIEPVETSPDNTVERDADNENNTVEADTNNEKNRDSDTPPPTLEQEELCSKYSDKHCEDYDNAPELVRVDEQAEEVVQNVVSSPHEHKEISECSNDSEAVEKPANCQVLQVDNHKESMEEESSTCTETIDRQKKSENNSSDMEDNMKSSDVIVENTLKNINSQTVGTTVMEVEAEIEANRSDEEFDVNMDTTSTKDESNLDITQSFSPDIRQITEVNDELQSLKHIASEILQITPKARIRSWGDSCIALELMKNSLDIIDVNTIKEFCPNLQILEESEIKMDIRERKTSYTQESRERRTSDRKVSLDFKMDDGEHKRLTTQSSVNSEMDEAAEAESNNSNIIAMNRKISIVDDTASKLKPPPSPAKNPISELLYITNLVRPFTLKQLKELLERTGKIRENGFWTDRIKSKCYAYYETAEEAEATRNALHGVNWPIGNGKKLMIEYTTEEELEKARNPTPPPPQPPVPQPPIANIATVQKQLHVDEPPKNSKPEESTRPTRERQHSRSEGHVREWDIGKENMHKPHYRSRERDERERERGRERERMDKHKRRRTPTPTNNYLNRKDRKVEEEVPQKLMDDLFRKTKTTPSVYWLPLTPEEIATKQQQRLLRMAEHKRRLEESTRGGRGDYGRGAPYRRRYD